MNVYHCTKCNKESVQRRKEKEISVRCCDGGNTTLHKAGKSPTPKKVVVKAAPVAPPATIIKPTPPRVTKLDQPAGDIKLVIQEPTAVVLKSEPEVKKPSPPATLP